MNVDGWINTKDKKPRVGDKCFICLDGIVQHEAFMYVESDDCPAYWSRHDVVVCPFVKDGQLWINVKDVSEAVQAAAKRDRELERQKEMIATKDAVIAKLRGVVLKMLDCWWPFVHGSVMPSVTAKRLRQDASDAIQPNDDSTLQEYVEKRLDESPEMTLLNRIGDLLEPVDYQGSYVDGIQVLVKQAKREGQAEMRERVAEHFLLMADHPWGEMTLGSIVDTIRALPIAGETNGIEGEN